MLFGGTMARSDEEKIKWCLKQKKGLKLVEPNDNLCREYLNKSKSSLNMLDAAIERDETEWIATTAYYSKYFALYALLQKCGIKCEIHDCTINTFKYLFVNEGITEEKLFDNLLLSKELRIETQYFVTEEIPEIEIKEEIVSARNFVLEMEKIIENFTEGQIDLVREKLKKLSNSIQ